MSSVPQASQSKTAAQTYDSDIRLRKNTMPKRTIGRNDSIILAMQLPRWELPPVKRARYTYGRKSPQNRDDPASSRHQPLNVYSLGRHRVNLLPLDIHLAIADQWTGCPEHLFDYLFEVGINPTEHPNRFRHWLRMPRAQWPHERGFYRTILICNPHSQTIVTVYPDVDNDATACGCEDSAFSPD